MGYASLQFWNQIQRSGVIDPIYLPHLYILGDIKFEIGDLVTTILGEYGIIIGIGEHIVHKSDETEYYHVLIEDHIYCYLPFALIKVEKI